MRQISVFYEDDDYLAIKQEHLRTGRPMGAISRELDLAGVKKLPRWMAAQPPADDEDND